MYLRGISAVWEGPDSDYESNPGPTGPEDNILSGEVVYESNTEVLNNIASFSGGQQIPVPGTGEALADMNGFEQQISNLWNDQWVPFHSRQGFRLDSWHLESKVPKSRISKYFARGLGNS